MSVRHALLALLSEGPKYGLQLREEFEARTGEIWQRAAADGAMTRADRTSPQNPTPAPLPRHRRETRQRG